MTRPFVDYYREQRISPVAQNVSDFARHLDRRESLYRALGIAPGAVRERAVLEFGPGSGHNALYTASLAPGRYVLVDANPVGLGEARALLGDYYPGGPFEFVESLVEEYPLREAFDLVIAEGMIPMQMDPPAFARTVAAHAAPRGVVVITCIDAVSHLSEIGRRLIADRLVPFTAPVRERLERLRPVFAPHLQTLGAMSRSVDDWILDSITHPFVGRLFSVPEALAALDGDFDLFGSSPQFVLDWRWYKELAGERRRFNARAADAYVTNVVNFLDYRHVVAPHDRALGERVMDLCAGLYREMQRLEAPGTAFDPAISSGLLTELAQAVRTLAPGTAAALAELRDLLAGAPGGDPGRMPAFAPFFGRGTQYLAFLRRRPG